MPSKSITRVCQRCQQTLPREAFALSPRADSPAAARPDRLCRPCRAAFDAEVERHRRRPNTTVLCACGCGRPTNLAPISDPGRGWVRGQPMRYLRGHNARSDPYPDQEYRVDTETGCWVWQLGRDRDGYGFLHRDGKRHRAHRWFYEQRFGPLPDGIVPDHLCRNPACVNPDHLRPLSMAENSRWKSSTKLTPEQVAEIRSLAGTMTQRAIADRFGITQSHAWRILNRTRWDV